MFNLYYFRIYDDNNNDKVYKIRAFSEILAYKKLLTSHFQDLPHNTTCIKIIQKTILKPKTTKKACKPTTPTQ